MIILLNDEKIIDVNGNITTLFDNFNFKEIMDYPQISKINKITIIEGDDTLHADLREISFKDNKIKIVMNIGITILTLDFFINMIRNWRQ